MHDLVITNGLVASGSTVSTADIAIDGRFIAAIGEVGSVGPGRDTIDADGATVAPGFVDAHTHDDAQVLRDPLNREKLLQGVTTVVCGNCGFSAFPNPASATSPDLLATSDHFDDFDDYADTLSARGMATNVAAFVGHNTLGRLAGDLHRRSSAVERQRVASEVARAVEQGALGVSTGLIYEPGRYATTDDLVEVVTASAHAGGIYASHIRSEAATVDEAVTEALDLARAAGCGVQISHLKTIDPPRWGTIGDTIGLIDRAHAAGADAWFDVYPYTAGSGPFEQYFDPAALDVERLQLVQIVRCVDFPHFEGRRIPDIAASEGTSIAEIGQRLLGSPNATTTICCIFEIDEDDMRTVLAHPRAMIGSDGIPQDGGVPHPRLLGAFPRVLGQFHRDEALFDLDAAIRKTSTIAAERFGLHGRGRLEPGAHADIVIFDHERVADRATYQQREHPVGIDWVLVNGTVAVNPDGLTGALPGEVLRRQPTN